MPGKNGLRLLGILSGIVLPWLVLYVIYIFNYPELEFQLFIERLIFSTLFAPLLSICVLFNLLLFFAFIWMDRDNFSWGVLFSTILYAFVIFGLKLFS